MKKPKYISFIVRFWQRKSQDTWLIRLEIIPGGEQKIFSDPEQMFQFIREQLGEADVYSSAD